MRRPSTPIRRIFGAAAITATSLGLVSFIAPGASSAAAAALSMPACTGAGLVVWLDTNGNGTAGSTYYNLELTNLSGHTCTLYGYPGVSAVDLDNRQLGHAATENAVHRSSTVTLSTGKSAIAILQITDVANFASTACHPTTAAGLRVYPPNQESSKLVPFPFRACSAGGVSYLHVEAVQP